MPSLLHHQSINQETNQRNSTTTAVHVVLFKETDHILKDVFVFSVEISLSY